MKKYYVDFGPHHNRIYVHPPTNPRGQVVEITEEQWKKTKHVPPHKWRPHHFTRRSLFSRIFSLWKK